MISNPAKFFINGEEEKKFTYEPGSDVWHFSPRLSGLSKNMEMNIIIFANDYRHALQIVEEMLKFALKCSSEYLKTKGLNEDSEYLGAGKLSHYAYLLENKDKWIAIPAPKNQVYKVGWASNDII